MFKTLQWLVQSLKSGKNSVGAVVVEDEGTVSRHLRHCASEQRLQMMVSGVFLFSHVRNDWGRVKLVFTLLWTSQLHLLTQHTNFPLRIMSIFLSGYKEELHDY